LHPENIAGIVRGAAVGAYEPLDTRCKTGINGGNASVIIVKQSLDELGIGMDDASIRLSFRLGQR
jgi:hypothetical protein